MDLDTGTVARILIAVGVVVVLAGVALLAGDRIPLGRLPGDISGSRGSVSWAAPLGTSLLLSVVLSVVLTVLLRR